MNCTNCGNSMPDGMMQCPQCGARVVQNSGGQQGPQGGYNQQQQQGGYGYNQQQQGGYGYNQQGFNQNIGIANSPSFTLFLIIGIVYSICCCNLLIGVPGIIFTCLMNNAFKRGDMVGHESNKKVAKWIYIAGILIGVLTAIFSFATGFLQTVAGMF